MSLPNVLTVTRFILVPLFIGFFFSPLSSGALISTYIFIFAGITDVLDGYIARKYNLITKWGQAMDPLADKLMQLTVVICFTIQKILPLWVIAIIGIKELLMIVGSIFLYTKKDKTVIPSNKYGKIATVLFYAAILAVAFGLPFGRELIVLSIAVTAYAFLRYTLISVRTIKKANI